MLTLMISCKDRHFFTYLPNFSSIFFLSLFRIIYYLCRWFGEKSGLMKAFAIISRIAKKPRKLLIGIKSIEIISDG